MILTNKNLYRIAFIVLSVAISIPADAAVVKRAGNRTSVASRMPTVTRVSNNNNETEATSSEPEPIIEEVVEAAEEEIIIENKTSQFDDILGETTSDSNVSDSELAAQIRAQRDAIDTRDASNIVATKITTTQASGRNTCDDTLRACMQAKCGTDYSKCAGDTDTLWGDKMDSCRLDTKCTGHEYAIFAPEIKADRDMNARVAQYTAIIDCGNKYNNCIIEKCGTTFGNCLGKSAGDKAIQDCSKIAKECQERDSGLASRMMGAFGTLRQDAEKAVAKDEEKLYALRDEMASTCKRLGAMFDERTLDCVYTVNFYAGDASTLYASKKLYAGSTFNCEPNWFGIDVTTFMENAFRLTREQTAASSAMLGAGLGVGVGAVTSGAIDRAVERSKAEKELKAANGDDKAAKKADKEKKANKKTNKKERKKKGESSSSDDTELTEAELAQKEKEDDEFFEQLNEESNQSDPEADAEADAEAEKAEAAAEKAEQDADAAEEIENEILELSNKKDIPEKYVTDIAEAAEEARLAANEAAEAAENSDATAAQAAAQQAKNALEKAKTILNKLEQQQFLEEATEWIQNSTKPKETEEEKFLREATEYLQDPNNQNPLDVIAK